MSAWEREIGELPSPTFGPVGGNTGGPVCFSRKAWNLLFAKTLRLPLNSCTLKTLLRFLAASVILSWSSHFFCANT